jgi:aryl-alcohol dehydrogenase-like predicted oxidoreductase
MKQSLPDPNLYGLPWTVDNYQGMPYQRLGSSGLRVSNIGLGTWKFGYPDTGDGSRTREKAALEILDHAAALGVTFWDTANRYENASGNSERILGTWFKSNPGQRRNIVVATKVFGTMDGRTPNHCRLSRMNVLESTYASLERLQVDRIDLLYFHDFDPTTPVEESLLAVEDLVSEDIVRYFAVSNFTADQIKLYRAAEQSLNSRCRIVAIQNQFDILNGEDRAYAGVMEYADQVGISFVAWGPLARGLVTDRYLDISTVGQGDRLYDEGTLETDADAETLVKVRSLHELAQTWEMELSQLAIAYMLTLPGMGPVIPSVSSIDQLRSNAEAGKMDLTVEQIASIRSMLASWLGINT